MSFEIGKQFKFEAAHCIKHHGGKCKRPHGHSYEFELIVESSTLRLSGPAAGMVDDYDSITEVGKWIEEKLDHHNLNEVLDSDTTTAEELSRTVWEMAKSRLPNLVEVRFKETAKTYASYRPQRLLDRRAREIGDSIMAEARQRLLDGIDTSDVNACWEFRGSLDVGGYGWCGLVQAGTKKAHRLAAWLAGDDIEDRVIMHTCDNPRCVNSKHLYAGTHEENEADKDSKGRRPVGENHGAAKLSEADVREIVRLRTIGHGQREVADLYSVSTSLVSSIMAGRVWRHITKIVR